MTWVEVSSRRDVREMLRGSGIEPGTRVFQKTVTDGHPTVMVSRGPEGWHLSISHRLNEIVLPLGLGVPRGPRPGRYPSWDEIHDARYRFLPDKCTMALLLPPKAEYVNQMETCFHLWEIEAPGAERCAILVP